MKAMTRTRTMTTSTLPTTPSSTPTTSASSLLSSSTPPPPPPPPQQQQQQPQQQPQRRRRNIRTGSFGRLTPYLPCFVCAGIAFTMTHYYWVWMDTTTTMQYQFHSTQLLLLQQQQPQQQQQESLQQRQQTTEYHHNNKKDPNKNHKNNNKHKNKNKSSQSPSQEQQQEQLHGPHARRGPPHHRRRHYRRPRIPNVLLAGAPKAGTTAITQYLQTRYPNEICLAQARNGLDYTAKEPHFFDNFDLYQQGLEYYIQLYQHCHNKRNTNQNTTSTTNNNKNNNNTWHPSSSQQPSILLDATPNSLAYAHAIYDLYQQEEPWALKTLKIIIVLREPMTRELSWYHHMVRDNIRSQHQPDQIPLYSRIIQKINQTRTSTTTSTTNTTNTTSIPLGSTTDRPITTPTTTTTSNTTPFHLQTFVEYMNTSVLPRLEQDQWNEENFSWYYQWMEQWMTLFTQPKQIWFVSYHEMKYNQTQFISKLIHFLQLPLSIVQRQELQIAIQQEIQQHQQQQKQQQQGDNEEEEEKKENNNNNKANSTNVTLTTTTTTTTKSTTTTTTTITPSPSPIVYLSGHLRAVQERVNSWKLPISNSIHYEEENVPSCQDKTTPPTTITNVNE